jgi:ATP-binding cassette, subfamily B, bacterial PglK
MARYGPHDNQNPYGLYLGMSNTSSVTHHLDLCQNIFRLLASLPPRRRGHIALLFVMQITCALLELLSIGSIVPFLTALTDIDRLMANSYITTFMAWAHITEPQHLTMVLAIGFGAGVILANLFRFLTLLAQQFLSAAIAVDLGDMLFNKTLHTPYSYFLKNSTSQFITNITNDLNSNLGTLSCLFAIITQGLIAIFVAGGLLAYNPEIALMLSAVILISYAIIIVFVRHRLGSNGRILVDQFQLMIETLQEGFGGIRYIILGGLQKNYTHRFKTASKFYRHKIAENAVIVQSPRFFLESIGVMAICIITMSFATQGRTISEIIPLMGLLVFGCYRLLPAVQQIYSSIGIIVSLGVSVERVIKIITEPLDPMLAKSINAPMDLQRSIELRNIYFDYHGKGESWTVENINLTIPARTTVALVGHTGSGKSTVSDLILGLIQPQRGQIIIDGTPLDQSNLREWQAGLAHVPQTIYLSDSTIVENIAFGVPSDQIDMERAVRVAKQAQIHDFIQTLAHGYHERVGERGIRLSGGERQRIGIARALYQNPALIVFDEATSALDNKTEQDVVQAIAELQNDLTILLIAHRLSTVQKADNILVFSKGRLVAQGKYIELLDNPYFRELVKSAELD